MTDGFLLKDGVLTILPETAYLRGQQFAGRSDIEKVIISEGTGSMAEEVFAECEKLREVSLPSTLVNIGIACFTGCPSLERIDIPGNIRSIDEGAFLDCSGLKRAVFREGLRTIADFAFENTGLETVTVPGSVTRVGEEAFFDCSALRHADVLNPGCKIGDNAFGSCSGLISGYIAPGFSEENSRSAELLYSLLWAGCPERHGEAVSARAEKFIRANEALIMEKIFKTNNIPALTGISGRGLLSREGLERWVRQALEGSSAEITALLLSAGRSGEEEDFEL